MKRLYLVIILCVFLIACSSEENLIEESKATEDVVKNETGELVLLKENHEIEELIKSGPIHISISTIQLGQFKINKNMQELFDNKEEVGIITVKMTVENTEDKNVSIYPDQAILTTNTGEQIDADVWLSDDVGGDFYGKVSKKGDVVFLLDLPVEEVNEIKLIIDPASDENYESLEEANHQVLLQF